MTPDEPFGIYEDAGFAPATPVERHSPRETPLERFFRSILEFSVSFLRTFALAAVFTPVLLVAFLTLDIPVRVFDRFFNAPALKPGAWLTWGSVVMAIGPMLSILMSRRFGGEEASRVVTASWAIAALAVFAEISYLAPTLVAGDFPSPTFIMTFVGAAMLSQYVAAAAFDVTRGGGQWWRAPLYSLMAAYALGSALYFPIVYWNAGAPWANWLVSDLAVKLLMAFSFLPIYWRLRKTLKPRGGFGGH